MKIRNIAHRGLWDETVPQNTLEAFRRAWAAGATWVETDFHRTEAGQMVCIHAERELWMYTGCDKEIAGLSPEEVASLRLDPSRPGAPSHVAPPCPGAGPAPQAVPTRSRKPGRNDPCPCGSGKKYKNCCGKA